MKRTLLAAAAALAATTLTGCSPTPVTDTFPDCTGAETTQGCYTPGEENTTGRASFHHPVINGDRTPSTSFEGETLWLGWTQYVVPESR